MRTYDIDQIREAMFDKKLRYYLCKDDIFLFAMYYFEHYLFCEAADFHLEMADDLRFKDHKFLMWIMFRESAKTVWAKIKVLHSVCYGLKKNIVWVSFDTKKADKQIMSIASELKSNRRIIDDFGQLYYEDAESTNKRSKLKRLGDFITTNNVSVRATSIMIPARGDIQDQFRPDLYIIDDIENMKTARSLAITRGIIENVEELLGGVAVDCDLLILSNRLARNGSVAKIEAMLDKNPKAVIHEVKVYDSSGKISWPSRFVETIKEAERKNSRISNKKQHFKSLEQMRFDLGTSGFNREMMLEPIDTAGAPIRMEWIKRETVPDLDRLTMTVAVDPAISQKQSADFFALCAGGRHNETGKIHTFRSYKTRCRISEQVNLLLNWHHAYPRATFRIETVAFQEALSQLIADERKRGVYVPVKDFKPNGDKLMRMQAIAPFIERGDVVFSNSAEMDELIENICGFPFIEHDDDVDAFISMVESFVHKVNNPGLLVM